MLYEYRKQGNAYYYCNVVFVWQRKGVVYAQYVELVSQEGFQVLSVQIYDLSDVVQTIGCRVFFYKKVSTFIYCVCLGNFIIKKYKIKLIIEK